MKLLLVLAIAFPFSAWGDCPVPSFEPPTRPDPVPRSKLFAQGQRRLEASWLHELTGGYPSIEVKAFALLVGRPEATCLSTDGRPYTAVPGCPEDRRIGETLPILAMIGIPLERPKQWESEKDCVAKQLRELRAWVALGAQRPALRAGIDTVQVELLDARDVRDGTDLPPPSFDEIERIRSARSNGGRARALDLWRKHHRLQAWRRMESEGRNEIACHEYEDSISPVLHERIRALKDGYLLERAELIRTQQPKTNALVLRPALYSGDTCNVITRAELDALFWVDELGPTAPRGEEAPR